MYFFSYICVYDLLCVVVSLYCVVQRAVPTWWRQSFTNTIAHTDSVPTRVYIHHSY